MGKDRGVVPFLDLERKGNAVNTTRTVAVACCMISILLASAQADMVAPGFKFVRHEFYFEGGERFSDYDFYFFPTSFSRHAEAIEKDEPITFYRLASPHIYGVPKGQLKDIDLEEIHRDDGVFEKPGICKSAETIESQGSVSWVDRTDKISTIYEITSVKDGVVGLQHISTTHFAASGSKLSSSPALRISYIVCGIVLSFLAVVAMVVWLLLRRYRRRTNESLSSNRSRGVS